MPIRKLDSGLWVSDFYPLGRGIGKRVRKKFATKGEALAFERFALDPDKNKEWLGPIEDKRLLSDLVESWFSAHGITLGDGERRKGAMLHACKCMGEPTAMEFSAEHFSRYREKRLKGEFARSARVEKISARTINLELAYFKAVFNELTRLGRWKHNNPVEHLRAFRTGEGEMAFLTADEIEILLKECESSSSKALVSVVKICLLTGARWSEAESLKRSQFTPHKITFIHTKGKRNRTVPISEEFYNEIPKKSGQLFVSCYSAFRTALKRTGIELPAGQLSHVLRHTFASHFMMNGGNILVLQRILGHTDIKMTMRYSHFSPDHLDEAVKFNPLAKSVAKVSQ
ncbi:phage integrase [Rouxiella chamberiensis]|uniref:phage integrase n=1 Tax=Rouxiella chamberiensis TaxID=1513468 RepID=UPI0005D40D24|nr:tyrosine-type recombinase/integrase [Rouxiella chamberiensis]